MLLSKMFTAAAVLGATSLIAVGPVAAAPLMVNPAPQHSSANIQTVQYRHWHGGRHHRGGWDRGYGYRHGYYRNGPAALGGLAAGAIIGGAIANSQARAANADSYCSQRFKSYDPASGTYLGYDGDRHPCP